MKSRITFIILFLLVLGIVPCFAEDHQGKMWGKLLPKLESALKLKDKTENLPESSLFKDDRKSNQEEINKLLEEAVEILSISSAQQHRKHVQDLISGIQGSHRKIATYQEKRISAPDSRPAWKTWEKTKSHYDEEIEEEKDRISELQNKIGESKEALRAELNQIGFSLSSEQLDFLLSTVVGDDIIEMSVAFDNIKKITAQLEQLMVNSGEDVSLARRYYGMYSVLLETMDSIYGQVLRDIDYKYLPGIVGGKDREGNKVAGIIPKTQALLRESRELLSKDPGRNKTVLTSNIKAQELTLQAANLYKEYLEKQRASLDASRRAIAPDIAAARNTYETVKVSSELIAMMKTGRNIFDTLKTLQIPELRPFENLEMKREFEKLTLQLQSEK